MPMKVLCFYHCSSHIVEKGRSLKIKRKNSLEGQQLSNLKKKEIGLAIIYQVK
jgi:hypothetical protein